MKKLSATKDETRQVLRILAEGISALVQPTQPVSGICRGPDDDPILSCAIAASVDYLVAGESDLLALREFRGARIVAPRDFELLLKGGYSSYDH